jgi:hypothetical protein
VNKPFDQASLRDALANGRVEWRKHVLQRMAERGILQDVVLQVLIEGERIEDYPDAQPYPSALFMALVEGRRLHVVAAFDQRNEWGYVITAYEPDLDHFEDDYRTRRRQ